jgi:5-methylcytosine-specific restriction protein B
MTQAEKIRQFALDHYVAPARKGGLAVVTIRAGDIHREMNLANAMPAVCSAIGSNKFEQIPR